jgi:signal transduction histidine kinase
VSAMATDETLTLTVTDNGAGADAEQIERGLGTGLRRLRERMAWLYGNRAQLELASTVGGGFSATLIVPRSATGAVGDHRRGNHDDE